jgi:hypothetical protein
MNAFREHHEDSIRFGYRCFDRLLLNAALQPFQQPERVLGFFWTYRRVYPISRAVLRAIATQYHTWVARTAHQWRVPILKAPEEERRDVFVTPYFRRAQPDRVVAILKAREPARYLLAIGTPQENRWHLELKQRWVDQYNFYINDAAWGRMFVRVCPYFPFSARICLNQHHWLARRMERKGIRFQQCANAFLRCSDPAALQALADSLTPDDLAHCGQKWLARLTPFFTKTEREQAGCHHRLFIAQAELCDNLVFARRAALDALQERLLDANRTIGRPTSLSVVFGRRITRHHSGKLQTVIEDLDLPNPVMRTHYKSGILKQYVRDRYMLRTEPASNNIFKDYGIPKAIEHLPRLRTQMQTIAETYLNVQQDILETFVDRGQLRQLQEPTVLPNGKRIPGLKPDHPRQLALMQALVRFAHIAAASTFTTKELHVHAADALGSSTADYTLGSLRYDLSKLRAKALVEKLPHSQRYRLLPEGYRICVVYLKLFEKLYAPLTAGILDPQPGDQRLPPERMTRLDRLYRAVVKALDDLVDAVGLRAA